MEELLLSIVIPTYNELENIKIFIPRIEDKFTDIEHEIIVVDDNSPDGTGIAARELNGRYRNIRVITRNKKDGIGAALREGYDCALGKIIISSDADLSFSADDMHRLYEKINDGYDLVVGTRHGIACSYYEMSKPTIIIKGTISRWGNGLLRIISGIDIHDFSANFRAVRKEAWTKIESKENTNIILFEMIIKARNKGMKIAELPVSFKDRIYGKSKLRLFKEISKAAFKALGYILTSKKASPSLSCESLRMKEYSLEQTAAKFIAGVASQVPENYLSIVYASPLSARSPDLCMLWHPGYYKKNKLVLCMKYLLSLPAEFSKYIFKRLWKNQYFSYALYGNVDKTLLVFPYLCGYLKPSGEYTTSYVKTDDQGVFVFGPIGTCGKKETRIKVLSVNEKLNLALTMIYGGLKAYLPLRKFYADSAIIICYWLIWVFRLEWLQSYYLENALSEVVTKYGIKKIGCIHEMHYYSRVIWRVAKKHNLDSYTVQHAVISSGKRWYFPYVEELEQGLILPSTMYIYDIAVEKLLSPYYKNTVFKLGCSSRYAHWKDLKESAKKGQYYLFAGALAGFDNNLVLSSIRKIISLSKEPLPIRVRLHPNAILSKADRRWLTESARDGKIKISEVKLDSDLNNAIVVIGMSTTVLVEALLLKRPVIQINHPDYLEYLDIHGIRGASIIDYRSFSLKDLYGAADMEVDFENVKHKLGLFEGEVNYSRLFS